MCGGGNELPSSAEEGRAAAAAEARVVLVNRFNRLTSTTPALRAAPPQLRRGICIPNNSFTPSMRRAYN